MLTRIAAVTGVLTLLVQGSVIFFEWPPTAEGQAWLTGLIVAVGAAVHSWFNPNVPVGRVDE